MRRPPSYEVRVYRFGVGWCPSSTHRTWRSAIKARDALRRQYPARGGDVNQNDVAIFKRQVRWVRTPEVTWVAVEA